MATYAFVDEWFVPADPQWVYDLLSRPREYPAWWDDVFLRGEGDPGPAAPGKRARLVTRGRLQTDDNRLEDNVHDHGAFAGGTIDHE